MTKRDQTPEHVLEEMRTYDAAKNAIEPYGAKLPETPEGCRARKRALAEGRLRRELDYRDTRPAPPPVVEIPKDVEDFSDFDDFKAPGGDAEGGHVRDDNSDDGGDTALLGSSKFESTYEIAGRTVQLGQLVADAHAKSGLTPEQWNSIGEAERDERIAVELRALREAVLEGEATTSTDGDAEELLK